MAWARPPRGTVELEGGRGFRPPTFCPQASRRGRGREVGYVGAGSWNHPNSELALALQVPCAVRLYRVVESIAGAPSSPAAERAEEGVAVSRSQSNFRQQRRTETASPGPEALGTRD